MKKTGIFRQIDNVGRIVLPSEIRNDFDLNPKDLVEIYVEGDSIILRKYATKCSLCGKTKFINDFKGKKVCSFCIDELKKM